MCQSCDLETDLRIRNSGIDAELKDVAVFQVIMIPMFIASLVREGKHWGSLRVAEHFNSSRWSLIERNEIPRFHILTFSDQEGKKQYALDFKHFFTVSRDYLYDNKNKRLFSIAPLYRERISQRFANYLSRIGLPDDSMRNNV